MDPDIRPLSHISGPKKKKNYLVKLQEAFSISLYENFQKLKIEIISRKDSGLIFFVSEYLWYYCLKDSIDFYLVLNVYYIPRLP